MPDAEERDWPPRFMDYLFQAFNTSAAFSPTDVLILSRRAKGLMMAQSTISLVVIAVLVSRAINTLGSLADAGEAGEDFGRDTGRRYGRGHGQAAGGHRGAAARGGRRAGQAARPRRAPPLARLPRHQHRPVRRLRRRAGGGQLRQRGALQGEPGVLKQTHAVDAWSEFQADSIRKQTELDLATASTRRHPHTSGGQDRSVGEGSKSCPRIPEE